ncbi:TPA: autotransporter outer membrane beta-barrel domain-containing protein, partial [Escherichia coli]
MLKKLITFSAILCTGQAWAACADGAAGPNGVDSATEGSTCDNSGTSYIGNNTAYASGSGSVLNFLPGTVISSKGVAAVYTLAVGGVNSGGSIPGAGATVHAKGDLTVNGNALGSTRSIFIFSGTDAGGKRNSLQIDGNLTATRTGGLYGAVIENTGGDLLVAGKTSLTSNVSDALRNRGDANSTFRGSTSINVSGSNGIFQSGGTVNFNGDLTINTTTGNGIKTSGGVLNARELYIDVKSGVGNGIAISDRGIVNISGGEIITEGKGSTAISLNGGAFSSTDALSILTKSNDSQGIVLSGDAKAILARTDIQTQGDNANGINIINIPTNGVTLYFQDAISIETLGGGSNAIASKNNPANGFVLPAGSMLVTQGENSHGIDMQFESGGGDLTVFELASGANIETHGKNASALFISNDDGEVNIKTASKIIASGAGSDGIEIDSALRGANIINTGEISASDIGINFNTGVQGDVFNAGTISSDNNIAVHFADEINTLTLTSGSQIKGSVLGGAFDDSLILQGTNSEDLSKFNDFNKLVMEGDEWTLNDNGIFSDSYTQKSGVVNLVGTLVTPQVNVEGGTLNLWKSQTWDTLINGGKISLNTTGNVGNTLNVKGDYNGSNGVLVFNTALGSDHSLSDKLVICGNAMGTTSVVVNNAGGTGAHTIDGIELIQVNGTSTDTAFTQAGRIVAGAYDYKLVKGNASGTNTQSWFLTNPDP